MNWLTLLFVTALRCLLVIADDVCVGGWVPIVVVVWLGCRGPLPSAAPLCALLLCMLISVCNSGYSTVLIAMCGVVVRGCVCVWSVRTISGWWGADVGD